MKKLLFLFLMLIPSLCWPAGTITIGGTGTTTISNVVASGSVTVINMKISAKDGVAHVDLSTANVLTDHIGHLLTIIDSAGKKISGWIKAAGTGETLATTGGPLNDGELLADPTFDSAGSWTIANAGEWDVNVSNAGKATAINTGTNSLVYQNPTTSEGMLLKLTTVCDSLTGGKYRGYVAAQYLKFALIETVSSLDWYGTVGSGADNVGIDGNGGFSGTFTSISCKQVMTPSATGVTITTTKDGATYNWTSKESGFNYNDSANYIYTISGEFTVTITP
jgi:hypothetical protein